MLCCVCLLETPKMLGIFDNKGKELNIAETINEHLFFKTDPDDILASHICSICWQKLDDFHEFYQSVENAHKAFQQKQSAIKEEIPNIKQEDQEQDTFEDNLMQIEININEEIQNEDVNVHRNPLENQRNKSNCDQDDDFDNENDTSDEYEPSETRKHEETSNDEISENVNKKDEVKRTKNNDHDYEYDICSSCDEYENSEKSEAESCTEGMITRNKKTEKKIGKVKNVKKCSKKKKSETNVRKNKTSIMKKKWTDKFLDPILTEEMIKKHINMICDLCMFIGKSFPDMVSHFKKFHPKVRPYIMCCDRKFTKRYYVAQHALNHEDPNYFRCEQCNKSFTTTCSLRTHNLSYHAPEEELLHSCELCPRKFARRNLLELHKPIHIPREEWTYFCTKCPTRKPFATSYLLNIHDGIHDKKKAANICHVCAKEIKDKHAFAKHVRLHFEDSGPRVKCPYPDCDSWLKDEDNLKSHLQTHNPKGKIYKCPDCGKQCKNRGALTNHKRYSHSNKVFQCEQCDKTFKRAIILREHMTQHTGETLYKCPFCTQTFNSNANMYSHKKKQHPIEWDEWRKNKRGSAQNFINNTNPLIQN